MGPLLAQRTAVVTGGSSGIGRAVAIRLAEEGAAVVVADLTPQPREGGETTADLITAAGGRAVFLRCDVTVATDRDAAVAAAEDLGALDLLVNAAGLFAMEDFLDVSAESYDRTEAVNMRGLFFMCQAAARLMVSRRCGAIVNVSSTAGLQGTARATTYCSTKFAVRGFTYALADELAPHGVRVNAVHPGIVETAMTTMDADVLTPERVAAIPMGRAGTPGDVADAIVLLLSDLAGYVTGSSLAVDGGRTRF